jgi:hypothetical protein
VEGKLSTMSSETRPEIRARKRSRAPIERRRLYIPVLSDELLGVSENMYQYLGQLDVLIVEYDPRLVNVVLSRLATLVKLQEWWKMPEPAEIDDIEKELLKRVRLTAQKIAHEKGRPEESWPVIPEEWLQRGRDFFESQLEHEIAGAVELLLIKSLLFASGDPVAAEDFERINRLATSLMRKGLQIRGKGRPKDTGYFGSRAEFEERLKVAITALRSEGKKITQAAVAKLLGQHTSRQLRDWIKKFDLNWEEVKSGE